MSFKKEIETLEEMVKTVKDDYWLYHSLVEQNFFGDFEHEKELRVYREDLLENSCILRMESNGDRPHFVTNYSHTNNREGYRLRVA